MLGGLHFIASNPERFARWQHLLDRLPNIRRTLPLEALLACTVLAAAALLSASATPEPAFANDTVAAPSAEQQVGDLNLSVTISPGGPGVNSISTVIRSGGAVVNDADVTMQIVSPDEDRRSDWLEMPLAGDGLYVTAGDQINAAGSWWTLLDISLPGQDPQRAAFTWTITPEGSVQTARTPGPLNILALLGVLAAVGYALFPLAYRLYRWLDWRPASVAIAGAALVMTAFFLIMAVNSINQG